jgi:hypothetical protein
VYLIDAATGTVLKEYDNLMWAAGAGPGGNAKIGKYTYGQDFPAFEVAQGGSQSYEWVAGVTVGTFAKTSAASPYSDFTADVIPVEKAAPVALVLKPGYASGTYAEYWRVWADLNRGRQEHRTGREHPGVVVGIRRR